MTILGKDDGEQRSRATPVYSLRQFNHASDKTNGIACECGIITLLLTRIDFAAMSDIYGACESWYVSTTQERN